MMKWFKTDWLIRPCKWVLEKGKHYLQQVLKVFFIWKRFKSSCSDSRLNGACEGCRIIWEKILCEPLLPKGKMRRLRTKNSSFIFDLFSATFSWKSFKNCFDVSSEMPPKERMIIYKRKFLKLVLFHGRADGCTAEHQNNIKIHFIKATEWQSHIAKNMATSHHMYIHFATKIHYLR